LIPQSLHPFFQKAALNGDAIAPMVTTHNKNNRITIKEPPPELPIQKLKKKKTPIPAQAEAAVCRRLTLSLKHCGHEDGGDGSALAVT